MSSQQLILNFLFEEAAQAIFVSLYHSKNIVLIC